MAAAEPTLAEDVGELLDLADAVGVDYDRGRRRAGELELLDQRSELLLHAAHLPAATQDQVGTV